jgi:hypothetical protein
MSEFIRMYSKLESPDLNVEITAGQGIDYLKEYLQKPQLHPELHPDVEKSRQLALKIVEALENAILNGVDPSAND